jgi:hypothetical protein
MVSEILQINLPGIAALAAPAVHGVRYSEGLYVRADTLRAFHASVILLCCSLSIVVHSHSDHKSHPCYARSSSRLLPYCFVA